MTTSMLTLSDTTSNATCGAAVACPSMPVGAPYSVNTRGAEAPRYGTASHSQDNFIQWHKTGGSP